MKDKIESYIFTSLAKLDSSILILLIPAMALLYIVLFVSVDDLGEAFESDEEPVVIECPYCHEHITIQDNCIID